MFDKSANGQRWRWYATYLTMMASGFAGLSYQIVWTQQSTLWMGHESAAVLAVVAAFFGGLAFGALACGPYIERSERPARWYVGCEVLIALWSLLLIFMMSPFGEWMLDITGSQPHPARQWLVAFGGTFLLLLPASAAMGATLPAMERVTAHWRKESRTRKHDRDFRERSIAALYAANTLGAVLGVLAIAFWLAPQLGFTRTMSLCVALNLACAVVAWCLFPAGVAAEGAAAPRPSNAIPTTPRPLQLLALTGLLGIGYEVLVVRVLSQVAENTVYTFALLLAVYLLGSATGAAWYHRSIARREPALETQLLTHRLLGALAMACLVGTASLWFADATRELALQRLGASMAAALAAETLMAFSAFGLPTFFMGALFCHLAAQAHASGVSFGRAVGINTLGAAAAPLLFGVLVFPLLGAKLALLAACFGYLLLAAWSRPAAGRNTWVLAPAGIAAALAGLAPPLAFIDVPPGGQVISYREGVMAAVSIVEDMHGVARLHINNRQQEGSNATLHVDGRQGLLPVLLHPAPREVLFLGLGTGITASTAAWDTSVNVDAVELLPEVIAASEYFTAPLAERQGAARPRIMEADARRYVRTSGKQYEVIVSDNFHPARSGSGSLYTIEHFTAVRERLSDDGIFCQWLPLHQLDIASLRSITRSFQEAFPHAWMMLASNSLETPVLGLVGTRADQRLEVQALGGRWRLAARSADPALLGLEDELAILGGFIAGPAALQRFAAAAPANTDDHPVVAYRAPRITYAPDSSPADRLAAVLDELSIQPQELLAPDASPMWSRRLSAYWRARDMFIETGRHVTPSADIHAMLEQVRDPLLAALRISADFRPAFDPLLLMAEALAQRDADAARALLTELVQLQPARTDAAALLRDLDSGMR